MTTTRTIACGLALLALGACTKGGRSDYKADADTGQAAPATVPTVNNPGAPDSTNGTGQRTGNRGVVGDTLGSKAPGGAVMPNATGDPRKKP